MKSIDEILKPYEIGWEKNGIDVKNASQLCEDMFKDSKLWYYDYELFLVRHWDEKDNEYDVADAPRVEKSNFSSSSSNSP